MRTLAAVARAPDSDFRIETLELGDPGSGEILVRVEGVGLCHTDLIFRDQFIPYPQPSVLGHEGAGIVEAVGPDVAGIGVGDAVILGFSSCGECGQCHDGTPSYCRDFVPLNYSGARPDGSTAFSDANGAIGSHFFGQSSFARHTIVRARNAVRIRDSTLPVAILGPLGCGLQTGAGAVLRSMDCEPGKAIAIWGGGPVGMAAVMAARIRGCAQIILVEPFEARRELGAELGATHTLDPRQEGLREAIREIVPGGLHYALDTSGNLGALDDALNSLASRGVLALVGVPKTAEDAFSVNIAQQITYGLTTMGIIEGDSDPQAFLPELLEYQRLGLFPFERLITTYPLSEINRATAEQAAGKCVKAVLLPGSADEAIDIFAASSTASA